MLTIESISVGYGKRHVLHDVSIRVAPGEAVAILGANGAGKTTMLNAISGFLRPTEGTIRFDDRNIERARPHEVVKMGLAHVPEGRRVFPEFSVRDNLLAGAHLRQDRAQVDADVEAVLASVPEIARRRDMAAGQLSGGEQQLLALYRALMGNPRMLMLDEPSMGLAPVLVRNLYQRIGELKSQGMTTLLVEQNLGVVLDLVDRVYVLSSGHIVFDGAPDELQSGGDVVGMYLGIGESAAAAPDTESPPTS